jgi:hypothetical protein
MEAGGILPSAFCSNNTCPVDASINMAEYELMLRPDAGLAINSKTIGSNSHAKANTGVLGVITKGPLMLWSTLS